MGAISNITLSSAIEDRKKVQVKDARGRTLTLEEPNFLSEFRLMEAVGPDLAANAAWMSVFSPITYVTAIDADLVPPVQNKMQAEALIQRIGRDGFSAILKALKEHFAASQADLDFAKNSAGTEVSASA